MAPDGSEKLASGAEGSPRQGFPGRAGAPPRRAGALGWQDLPLTHEERSGRTSQEGRKGGPTVLQRAEVGGDGRRRVLRVCSAEAACWCLEDRMHGGWGGGGLFPSLSEELVTFPLCPQSPSFSSELNKSSASCSDLGGNDLRLLGRAAPRGRALCTPSCLRDGVSQGARATSSQAPAVAFTGHRPYQMGSGTGQRERGGKATVPRTERHRCP